MFGCSEVGGLNQIH